MSKDLFSRETPDVTGEACAWIAQLETGELTTADRDAFREWMSRSPRHAAEIRRLAGMSMELNVLTQMAEPIGEAAARYPSILRRRRRSLISPWRLGAFGAALAVMVFAVAFMLLPGNFGPGEQWLLETAVGEQRDVRLPDGTLVTLNTDSRLEIEYDGAERTGRLLKGEAFFDVATDPGRPFLVHAGEKYIRVVGTAFVIRLLQEDFTVTVVEGQVELAEAATNPGGGASAPEDTGDPRRQDAAAPALRPIFLEAGQSITIPASRRATRVVTKSERDLQRELSWQEGLHDFSETPLEDVIREISRYSPLEVEIADPALRDIRFGGIFRTGETQPLLDALQASYGVEVEYIGERKVRLSLMAQGAGQPGRGERD